jgi:phospholipid/cholesterol/gamma-HCH transport system permease protein
MMNILTIFRPLKVFPIVGNASVNLIKTLGQLGIFMMHVMRVIFKPPFYWRTILRQLIEVGYYSLPVVGLTAIFTGAVLALQSYTGFSRMSAESAIPSVVVLSITRELGPVLAGLMLAGRLGAAIAAEIGTMRVTEQIDALYTLHTDPIRYLITPRIIAGAMMLPLVVLAADIIGVFGGYLISVYKLGFSPHSYLRNTFEYLKTEDVISGLIKASIFGYFVCLIGCFYGYKSQGGAQGVGNATTQAVVSSSIMILLMDYLITGLLFSR